jgi:hypothetical protein
MCTLKFTYILLVNAEAFQICFQFIIFEILLIFYSNVCNHNIFNLASNQVNLITKKIVCRVSARRLSIYDGHNLM